MYGTLINNILRLAPKKVIYEDSLIFNPPDSVYEALGYYPVTYTDMPEDAPTGYRYISHWEQGETSINQIWTLEEDDPNIPDEEAFSIIMGETA